MSTAHLDAMMNLAQSRAEVYLHAARRLMLEQFGPASEHVHTEAAVALAAAMMQHEGAQIIADTLRSAG
jgi:hypothetical protein